MSEIAGFIKELVYNYWQKVFTYIFDLGREINRIILESCDDARNLVQKSGERISREEEHCVKQTAIKTVYPKYYPKEVVDFFCKHHSKEHILEGIASGNMGVLIYNDLIVGTGCFDGNHITGVYVLPSYQNQGCGSHMMNCLEKKIENVD